MRWRWRRRIEDSARRSGHGQPARINGFSLHAAVRCDADDRQALEQLCRTITCPAQETRTRAMQRRRPGRAQAEDALARRHHAPGDVAAGVRSRGRLRPQLCATGQRDPIVRVGPQFIPARGLFSPCSPAAHRLLGGGQWLRCPRPSDQVPEPAPAQSGKELLNSLSSVLQCATQNGSTPGNSAPSWPLCMRGIGSQAIDARRMDKTIGFARHGLPIIGATEAFKWAS